jgi:2-succinyl-6-hydroxy-2,4-cyclohexadiene-1-carboxylate synthase
LEVLHRLVEGGGSRRVVLVHGFTQTLRTWDAVASELVASGHQTVRVDLPGHGGSTAVRLEFEATAAAIGEAGGPAVYVGYSLGGRLCLRLAVDRPDLVAGLVLLGSSPGLADAGERATRRAADEALALEIEAAGTEVFLHRWLSQPLFAGLRVPPEEFASRRANCPDGLAAALRQLGTGVQAPLWEQICSLRMPVLLVVGLEDRKFCDVARAMADAIGPTASLAVVAGAGHAVHLEEPQEVATRIFQFVTEQVVTR